MTISLKNTLTRQKEVLEPLEKGHVRIYVCGVTTYDDAHVGHARAVYVFDVLRRFLRHQGLKVTLVRNITDVDDKIIERGKQVMSDPDSPLRAESAAAAAAKVAAYYTERFHEDMRQLGLEKPDVEPKATEHIPEMIEMIRTLIEKGMAYAAEGNVYYRVSGFEEYGCLSGQSREQMISGARAEVGAGKQDPLDFALWKASKEDEPAWESPWGLGRPGWHIECSAMSIKYLGEDFDIHGGGRDLIFPHHENEIAQSRAATGAEFAHIWLHNGLLSVDGQKMSKSLGNYVSISEFLKQYPAEVLKLFYASSHYSSPCDYTEEKLNEHLQALQRLYSVLAKVDSWALQHALEGDPASANGSLEKLDAFRVRFVRALSDDLNTPVALAALFDLANAVDRTLGDLKIPGAAKGKWLKAARSLMSELGGLVGILSMAEWGGPTDREILSKVKERGQSRTDKAFAKADEIREELSSAGITLEDQPDGTSLWWRKLR
ncbi:MAG: cysteine--tRNA ligase [Candidatus Omnitrophica bacterium]|nr:cysteine--tRNA ligase [Candidatus Omnitrophota bacterium]